MNKPIDWSSGWACSAGAIPSVAEIENLGNFRHCMLTSKLLKVEVECKGKICEISLTLNPGADLNQLVADLNQDHKGEQFSMVQDMIDYAWEKWDCQYREPGFQT